MAVVSVKRRQLFSKTITLNLQEGDPPSLNPYVGVDLRSRCLYLHLYEPLMRRGQEGDLELAAAQAVEVDETQTKYTFHIRPHRWSNGESVTAHHFEKAWKYALRPGSHVFRADLFYPIKNAERVKKGELLEEFFGNPCSRSTNTHRDIGAPHTLFFRFDSFLFLCTSL